MKFFLVPLCFFFYFTAGFALAAAAEVKEPSVNDLPDIELNFADSAETYRVKVTLYGKEPLTGVLRLEAGGVINTPDGRTLSLREIRRITVSSWSGQERGRGRVFYPSGYEIILNDNTKVQYDGNIGFLNRIRFRSDDKKNRSLYTYFYDYFKNGRWINTETAGESEKPLRPATGCLYIIEVIQ